MRVVLTKQQFEDPGWFKQLIGNPMFGFGWFFVRLYLGFQWLEAGWHKVYGASSVGWVDSGAAADGKAVAAGDALLGYWTRAATIPTGGGRALISYGWYRDFLQYMIDHSWHEWFVYVIAYGELLIGVGLVVGAFTGIAAFFGAALNFNFMLAGTASTNPVLFGIAILMIVAWKNAGYVGVDRWLLPLFGTPWQPSKILHPATDTAPTSRPAGMTGRVTGAGGD